MLQPFGGLLHGVRHGEALELVRAQEGVVAEL
jgi:hypothetical protein